jgi:hypothetical protein
MQYGKALLAPMISMLMCFLKEIHTMESLDFVAAYFY